MKLQYAERRRGKLKGSTVKSLNRWSSPRGDGQAVESGAVKPGQASSNPRIFKKVAGRHGPSWALGSPAVTDRRYRANLPERCLVVLTEGHQPGGSGEKTSKLRNEPILEMQLSPDFTDVEWRF
jgi:hypothetical protein